MGFFRFVPAGVLLSVLVDRPPPRPRPAARRVREIRDATIVGAAAPARRHGPRRLGRADDPHRHRRAADRAGADVARDLRLGPVPGAGRAARRRRHRRRARSASRSSPGPRAASSDLDPAGLVALVIAPMFWSLGTLYATKRAVQPAPALLASGIQMTAAGLGFAVVAALTGEWSGLRPRRGLRDELGGDRLPRARRQPHRLHDVRLADRGRAAAAGRDVRVRQPGRRGHPRRDRPRRSR